MNRYEKNWRNKARPAEIVYDRTPTLADRMIYRGLSAFIIVIAIVGECEYFIETLRSLGFPSRENTGRQNAAPRRFFQSQLSTFYRLFQNPRQQITNSYVR